MDVEEAFNDGVTSLVVQKINDVELDPWTSTVIRGTLIPDSPFDTGFGTGQTATEAIERALKDLKPKGGNTNE